LLWDFDDFTIDHRPQLLVQIGPLMTSPSMEQWLNQIGAESHIILSRDGWPDPVGRCTHLVVADPSNSLRAMADSIDALRGGLLGERPWFLDWREPDTRAVQAVDAWFAAQPTRDPGELSLVRSVLHACPPGTQLVLGNSLPVREAAVALPAGNRDLRVYANRGANGIDGLVSTAIGIALAQPGPTVAVVGDISFLHDIGALWSAREITTPFVLVVIDNHGGRIFEQLPIRDCVPSIRIDAWTTPHELELWAAGLVFGIETSRPKSLDALAESLRDALGRTGPTLIHVTCASESARLDAESLRQYLADKLFG
jgi:2-succinyl-5-enolpyruvyl-6-hydroxy-3-cyclohexene-1-carboxylate synthase